MEEKKDEAGLPTLTYTNKLEQTILSRTISGADTLDTYQVYDDFGNLVLFFHRWRSVVYILSDRKMR